jgi:hypothetical protein
LNSELDAIGSIRRLTEQLSQHVQELVKGETFERNNGKRTIIATGRHNKIGTPIETLIGLALAKRNADVSYLLCDQVMPACDARRSDRDTQEMCAHCWHDGHRLLSATSLPVAAFSHWISEYDLMAARAEIDMLPRQQWLAYVSDGVRLGQIAYSSVLRYLMRGSLSTEAHWDKYREFLVTAALLLRAGHRLLDELQPDAVFVSHGIYVTWGVLTELAVQRGIRTVVYGYGYRRGTILMSVGASYHSTLTADDAEHWAGEELTGIQEEQIRQYLQSRANGGLDWIAYNSNPTVTSRVLRQRLGVPSHKPVVGFFLNIPWDAAVVFRHATFQSMVAWLHESLLFAASHPGVEWVFRCHPAEHRFESRDQETCLDIIQNILPDVPSHIHILAPEAPINTYDLAGMIDLAVVYTTKVGLEFAARGLPVIVTGDAFYRGKGFTWDPATPQEYFELLLGVPGLRAEQTVLALRYAYYYFFRRYIELPGLGDQGVGEPVISLDIESLDQIEPGADFHLDLICDTILNEREPIVPRMFGQTCSPE